MYNQGISKEGDLIDLAVESEIIKKSGAWFSYGEDRFNGREKFRTKLKEDAKLLSQLEKDVKKHLGMNGDESVDVEKKEKQNKK